MESDVWLIQIGLMRAGEYGGKIDGVFGEKTREAAERFRKRRKIRRKEGFERELMPFLKGFLEVKARGTAGKMRIPLETDTVYGEMPMSYKALRVFSEGLAERYPFLGLSSAGESVMGKEILLFSFGKGGKKVFLNGTHHANEYITASILLKFIEKFSAAYVKGEDIGGESARGMYEKVKFYVVPAVNPDGMELAAGALTEGKFYSIARRYAAGFPDIPFPEGWKANIRGVDLNLNYPAGWDTARKMKGDAGFGKAAPRNFPGTEPFSEPETRAMKELTEREDFDCIAAFHSQGKVIYPNYRGLASERALGIAQKLGDASGYTVEDTPYFSGFAGYKDWFIEKYGRLGFTVEVGFGENPLPLSDFEKIYQESENLIAALAREI